MAKEKKIVNIVDEDTKSEEVFGKDKAGNIIRVEDKGEAKPRATKFRIFAFILWAIGLCCEVIAVLRIFDKINWLPNLELMWFLIIFLVIDAVAVIAGSMLWKKANHIDPASEKNQTKFWIQNNLGTIVAILAFLPLVIIIFTNKDMDNKTKTVTGIVAVVLMLIAGIASYDFNPVSSEMLARAEKEVQAVSENGLVYWAPTSKKYHVKKDCPAFSQSETVYEGTVKQAFEQNLTEPCRRCIPELHEDHDHE